MPNESHFRILKQGVVAWNAWRADNKEIPDLYKANLQEANLQEANLQEANLQEANLTGADLTGADLQEANLQEANLQEANLQEANLQEANLTGADVTGADVTGANLQQARLVQADLQEANLQEADLQEANLKGANLQKADLQRADLRKADLSESRFIQPLRHAANRVNLRGTNLQEADLKGAYLHGADLQEANLRGADLRGADLRGADLQAADLTGADLRAADLRGADLTGADLRGADLRGAYLQAANFRGADLHGANLDGANLRGVKNLQGEESSRIKRNWSWMLFYKSWIPSIAVLVGMLAGLLLWLLQPVGIPPAEQLRDAASAASFLLLIAACTGIAAMATVQFWKILFHPRSAFHAAELRSVFGEHMEQVLGLAAPTLKSKSEGVPAINHPDGHLRYLLNNPTELVMGQVRSAADYILLNPKGFEDALHRLAGGAGKIAVSNYVSNLNMEDDQLESDAVRLHDEMVEVRFFVEQHLNLVHVTLRERWRRRVRTVATFVAGSVGLLAIMLVELGPVAKISVVFAGAIWGGFFSWFARDLVALVERRRP